MSACITKSNKFKDPDSKLLRLSYVSIKFRKFGTLKNTKCQALKIISEVNPEYMGKKQNY